MVWGHKVQTTAPVGGIGHKHEDDAMYPGSGPSCGGNTPTPARTTMNWGQKCYRTLLEMYLVLIRQGFASFSFLPLDLPQNSQPPSWGSQCPLYTRLGHWLLFVRLRRLQVGPAYSAGMAGTSGTTAGRRRRNVRPTREAKQRVVAA